MCDVTISIVYVEDNEIELLKFEQLVKDFPELELLATFNNTEEALEFCASCKPNLVLIDIELNGENGLTLGEKLQALKIPFAFLTSHEGYAVKAFEAFAEHYILKPITVIKLRELINRHNTLKDVYDKNAGSAYQNKSPHTGDTTQRILVNTQRRILVLELKDIVYLEADGGYTKFHLEDGTVIISGKVMKTYEVMVMDNPDFAKINRSYIINQSHLHSVDKKKNSMTFCFKNKMQFSVAKFNRKDWEDQFS